MRAWALLLLLFVDCGSGTNNAEFAPCSNVACTPASLTNMTVNVLCKSTCADGFACISVLADKSMGTCMRLCASDADCTHNVYKQAPPMCSTALAYSNVIPAGWCVDGPTVTQ